LAIELDENWLREELLLDTEELLATELTEFGFSVPWIEDDDSAIGAIGEDDSSGEHAIKARVVTAVMGKNFLIIK
jgi:hypothetical protein